MIEIVLPWPPKQLNPNQRVHWTKKSSAAKKYRRMCHLLALQAGIKAADAAVLVDITFCPPDRRKRDDDNCLASFKSGRDGLADAMGIDDNSFSTAFRMGEPVSGGAVRVRISSAEKKG